VTSSGEAGDWAAALSGSRLNNVILTALLGQIDLRMEVSPQTLVIIKYHWDCYNFFLSRYFSINRAFTQWKIGSELALPTAFLQSITNLFRL
jgi:hypothetical protein